MHLQLRFRPRWAVAAVCLALLTSTPLGAQERVPSAVVRAALDARMGPALSLPPGRFPTPPLAAIEAPDIAIETVAIENDRGLIPPGTLRYRVPERARPYVLPYAAVGTALLVTDERVLRTLKLDSLYLREDGTAAQQAHAVFRAFSGLGDPPLVAALLGTLFIVGGERERDAAKVGGVAYGNAIALTALGKFLTGKERPYVSGGRVRYHGPNPRYASFPSGHSSGTMSVAHVLAHYYPEARPLWYGTAGMAGLSRIALARHWPSDVWWGWGVGVLGAEGALGERDRIERWWFW
jgi:membrane-associated phospholipid phosphatase